MTEEHLEILWRRLESATDIDNLTYDERITIGGVFGEMKATILEQQAEIARLEKLCDGSLTNPDFKVKPKKTFKL